MFFAILLGALLHTSHLEINRATVTVEIADTPASRDRGLMERDSLEVGHGMLFVYDKPTKLSFWMKNTRIPLSIGFFSKEKRLLQIEDMDPPKSKTAPLVLYNSLLPAQYALEVPQGWFTQNKITPGMKFTLHDLAE